MKQHFYQDSGLFLLILLSFSIELIYFIVNKKKTLYNGKDTKSNIGILAIYLITKPLSTILKYILFAFIGTFSFFKIEVNWWTCILTFFVADFLYYCEHVMYHKIPFLWTIHHTHHSSPWYNFSTAFRIHLLENFIRPIFYIPFLLLGFSAEWMIVSINLIFFYQFFLHTRLVNKLGWFEGKIFSTPSSHRVHHGSNKEYIDKNYGGVFVFFDRIFNTYEPEVAKVKFGVTTGFYGFSPFKILFKPLKDYFKGQLHREKKNIEIKNRREDLFQK